MSTTAHTADHGAGGTVPPAQRTKAPDGRARAAQRKVPTRRMSFEESLAAVPKHFATDGNIILSHLAAALSSLFPDGEEFFVRSVRRLRDQVTEHTLYAHENGIDPETITNWTWPA